ncbi:MAG: Gfo/Idh/MocA family oxidoreductase [Hyphomicrobiaceae bacterium]|nr:Gfo/Idh/MocA family oxidoreductase [Hyphomicrobiaceae bacterium]
MNEGTIGFGITGPGMIAEFHAQALAAIPGARLVAVHGRNAAGTEAFAARHGLTAYLDFDAFLRHPGLDAIAIATPSGSHLEPAVAAARAGKHVVCEKPLEVTPPRIDRIVAACAEAGVTLAGIFPRRFNPATIALRDAVAAGRFGRIALAEASIKWWRPQAYYDSAAWRGTWALDGGGVLMNQGIHTIDLLLHVMGPVRSVRARTALIAHERIEVEDTAVAMLTFETGALGVIQGSTACWSEAGHPAEIQICGDRGSAFLRDDRFRVWEFREPRPEDADIRAQLGEAAAAIAGAGAADPKAIDYRWHQRNFEDAIDAIRTGHPPAIDGHQARRAVALITAIYASAAKGGEEIVVG